MVFAGREYGTGSSRDWAAKGTKLLGVRAVVAQSFERIHRSNLVGMGVLPLVFEEGTSWQTLGLKGDETVTIAGLAGDLKPRQILTRGDHVGRRHGHARAADLPHRYARRARIFPQRRHSAVRAAAARGLKPLCSRAPTPALDNARVRESRPRRGRLQSPHENIFTALCNVCQRPTKSECRRASQAKTPADAGAPPGPMPNEWSSALAIADGGAPCLRHPRVVDQPLRGDWTALERVADEADDEERRR